MSDMIYSVNKGCREWESTSSRAASIEFAGGFGRPSLNKRFDLKAHVDVMVAVEGLQQIGEGNLQREGVRHPKGRGQFPGPGQGSAM